MFLVGGASMLTISLFNISVQLSVPRWVTARALSLYSSALTGGIALGSWFWGSVASHWSLEIALIAAGIFLLLLPLCAIVLRLPEMDNNGAELVPSINEPEVALAITMRSGPVVIEIEYPIDPDDARAFYTAMLEIQRARLRNGGFNWSISRDLADPTLWTERYHFPTWADYLRMRDRFTLSDQNAQRSVDAFIIKGERKLIRRRLERPFGSVRWKVDTPDPRQDATVYIGP
jgi:hypothetical protein